MHGTLQELLRQATTRLAAASATPRLDAEVLLAHALGRERSHLLAHADETPETEAAQRFETLLTARARGEPVAYLTSKREFWSLALTVTPATLIPRPETELLVEQALERVPTGATWPLLDLGTGSGAIALALASELPACQVTATDASAAALEVARGNAKTLGISNVEFVAGDWFNPLAGRRFRVIVSNPPYVEEADPHLSEGDVRFEPRSALASGPDGLDAIRRIVAAAPAHLETGASLLLEHGWNQGAAVRELLRAAGFRSATTYTDIAGHERVSAGIWVK